MTHKRLYDALKKQDDAISKAPYVIAGTLGIMMNGVQVIEVPGRNGFVYVQLRETQNELIQAMNDQVSPVYGLPVLVVRQGMRYVIQGRDTQRYQEWGSYSSFLPRHANTHSFNPEGGGAGDTVYIYPRQFMPLLAMPSGTAGSPNILLNAHTLKNSDGTFSYIPLQASPNLTVWNPPGSNAVMVLVYLDTVSKTYNYLVGSGSYFAQTITGTSAIPPYIPSSTNPLWIPDSAIRLVSGTAVIGWDNIYDLRQYVQAIPSGTPGGQGGTTAILGVMGQNSGVPLGTGTTLNFRGPNVTATISGTVIDVFVTGSSGGGVPTGPAGGDLTGTYPNPIIQEVNVAAHGLVQKAILPVGGSAQRSAFVIDGGNTVPKWAIINTLNSPTWPQLNNQSPGTGTALAYIDHIHPLANGGTSSVQNFDDAAFVGTSGIGASAQDHKHGMPKSNMVMQSMYFHNQGGTVPATTTYYLYPGILVLTAVFGGEFFGRGGTLKNLLIRTNSAQPANNSMVMTMRVSNVATAMQVVIAAGAIAGGYADTTHFPTFNANTDYLTLYVVNNANVASAQINGITWDVLWNNA